LGTIPALDKSALVRGVTLGIAVRDGVGAGGAGVGVIVGIGGISLELG